MKRRLLFLTTIISLLSLSACGLNNPSSIVSIDSNSSISLSSEESSEPVSSSEMQVSSEVSSETYSSEDSSINVSSEVSSETYSSEDSSIDASSESSIIQSSEEEAQVDELYVEKVKNMSSDFIRGVDISSVIALENGGTKFYNEAGKKEDIFKIFADNGANYIRVRVWNDPYDASGNGYGGGNNDIAKAVQIGQRATQYGMKLLVDFHYSDFWADPVKYKAPKAWANMNIDQKADALYNYTVDSLNLLKNNSIDVGMVAIGNEINTGLAGELRSSANYFILLKKASQAVREVLPEAKIAVHYTNPEKNRTSQYCANLNNNNVDYDVFAYSYYPHYHGTQDNLVNQFNVVANTYDKEVMIMETSYGNTTSDTDFHGNSYFTDSSQALSGYPISVEGQALMYRDLCDLMVNRVNNNKGIGVCYWEGAWITAGCSSWSANSQKWQKYGSGWASSYAGEYDPDDAGKWYGGSAVDNQAFFDKNGKALKSIQVFGGVLNGSGEEPVIEGVTIYKNGKVIEVEDSKGSSTDLKGKYVLTLSEGDKLSFKDTGEDLYFYHYDFDNEVDVKDTTVFTATKNGEHTVWYNLKGELWVDEPEDSSLLVYLSGTMTTWTFKDQYLFSASSNNNYQYELLRVTLSKGTKIKAATSYWGFEWSYSHYKNSSGIIDQQISGGAKGNFINANDGHDNITVNVAGSYNIYIDNNNILCFEIA